MFIVLLIQLLLSPLFECHRLPFIFGVTNKMRWWSLNWKLRRGILMMQKNSFMMEKKVARWIEWKFQFKSSQSEVKKRIKREKMSALSTDNKVSGDNMLWNILKNEIFLTFEFKNFAELWFSLLTKKFLCNSRF